MINPISLSSGVVILVLLVISFTRYRRHRRSSRIKIELLSLATLFCSIVVRLIVNNEFSAGFLAMDLCSAGLLLIAAPLSYEEGRFLFAQPVIFALSSFIISVLGAISYLPIEVYPAFVAVNTVAFFSWYYWSRFVNRASRPRKYQARYNMLNHVENTFRLFLFIMLSVAFAVSSHMPGYGMLCVNVAVFVFLYARSVSGMALFPAVRLEKKLWKEMDSRYGFFPQKHGDDELYERCCRYMRDRKPFLVESYSIDDLANAMLTNRAYLSKSINLCSDRNFRQFVNHYRIKHAVEMMTRDPRVKSQDLAQLCGFHNQVSFNMAFKLETGTTPGEWKKLNAEKLSRM